MGSLKFSGLVLLLFLVSCRQGSRVNEVAALDERFVRSTLALSPAAATMQGYHEHNGAALDELLDDYSPSGIQHAREIYQQFLREINGMDKSGLTVEDEADLEIMRLQCESQLLDLDHIQAFAHNPTVYIETIGNAIYSPFILNYAPEAKRFAQITARIEKIPALLASARQNLKDAPEIWNQVAREENDGNIKLIDETIRAKVTPDLKSRYDAAATNAIAALRSFDAYLATDLSRRIRDWRLGPALYPEKFKLTLATGDTVQKTLSAAEAKLNDIRQDMRNQATAIYGTLFPGKTPAGDLNTTVSQVLDRIAQVHAKPGEYFDAAKRDLADTTNFVKDKNLLGLPQGNLAVIETPEFMRGIYGVGGFSPAPALEPQLGSYYWITPFTPDMTTMRVESKLREYNLYGLKILTIHEAMPGHYVQAQYANQVQPKWRGALRAIYGNTPYVEGWAVYATQLMIDSGYQNTPEMRLTFGKQMLRVVSNTILDIRMHTMGMTDQQALDLMINDTFQEKEEAEKKLQRAKLSSCQLPTYFVGWRGWQQLRQTYEKRRGSEFRLSEFHERALREGAIPLPVLSRVVVE